MPAPRRVSKKQLEDLIEWMEKHPLQARGAQLDSAEGNVDESGAKHLRNNTNSGFVTMDEIQAEIHEEAVDKGNEIKVLPQCDNLRDLIQLDRNNKSFVDAKLETDRSVKIEVNETQDVKNTIDDTDKLTHSDDKLSSLEEVVEKVVELYTENEPEPAEDTKTDAGEDTHVNRKDELTIETETTLCDQAEDEMQEEDTPEQASPSQSESSRATRWEALADIAAELPPSLAVDPVTGQIYTLTK